MPGKPASTNWTDIPRIGNTSRERLGYPTQKPLALLERIITASSDEGDMVLDPFCGCGTTVVAAHKLNRRWAGIDIIPFAIDLIVQKWLPEFKVPTEGYPYDLAGAAKLAREQPFKFEKWAVTRVPGLAPNDHQVGGRWDRWCGLPAREAGEDHGSGARTSEGREYRLGDLRDFISTLERERAAIGVSTPPSPRFARTEPTLKLRNAAICGWARRNTREPNSGQSTTTSTIGCRCCPPWPIHTRGNRCKHRWSWS